MIVKQIEQKIKIALLISVGSFVTAIIMVGITSYYSYNLVAESRQKIYVLDGGIPLLIRQTALEENREVEYRSHVSMYHRLFFTLPPDDEFIQEQMSQAMYLVDESGLTEYNNLKEKGYYNAILASSAVLSIRADSIELNLEDREFTYYGTQRIERKSSILTRQLITTGKLREVLRSSNNPHGVLITDWKTILNKDISRQIKNEF